MDSAAQLEAYLRRIGLARPPACDERGLLAVQSAHRQAIPFENLDVRLGVPIPTETDAIAAKLVERRRGGFCFEHNRLFSAMLSAMGFANRMLLARVNFGNPPATPAQTHCLLAVETSGGLMIADAGFGGSYCPPLPLQDGATATSGDGAQHRLRRIGEPGALPGEWQLERIGPPETTDGRGAQASDWEPQYTFSMSEVAPADLVMGSHFASTHPTARHVNCHVASRVLPDGFVSLMERRLTVYRAGETQRREIAGIEDYREALADHFGIAMDADTIASLPLFAEAD
ncbi:arylamine N-acetyltransferase family protein [Aurantiacibacter poecillastricola]|uniref:arylamine N-acetyltransferase family protein n=1 Tax=Aurantiacibacter poecillastricola TaxID=3064385 RepID=UPI00273FABBC|nr:arylamine N-acetyltransferase [Aurantiacibacter sp. 219JJ12-13]MDP5260816.1 arylamine N-acetyltransferase [Aurantiacibacter sp. 219JJ12-13]